MTKMAAMPICGKNLKKSSSLEPKGRWPWNLVCSIGCMSTTCTKFVQMMTLGWPWQFTARSNLVPYAFVWEKGKTIDFLKTIVVYDLKLVTDDGSDKKFLLTWKLCPLGAVCPLPHGYIHVFNHEKNCVKSDFKEISLKLATNGKSDKAFLLTSKFCPPGDCLLLPRGYIHVLNHEKNCIKSDFKAFFFKLATNEWSDKIFLLTLKICPLGAVCPCPCPGAIYMYKIMKKKLYKIRLRRDFLETCNKWPKWQDVPVDIKILSPRGCQLLPWGYIHV